MSLELVPPDSIAGGAAAPPPPFVCSWTSGGLDAGWVRVAGELGDLRPVATRSCGLLQVGADDPAA